MAEEFDGTEDEFEEFLLTDHGLSGPEWLEERRKEKLEKANLKADPDLGVHHHRVVFWGGKESLEECHQEDTPGKPCRFGQGTPEELGAWIEERQGSPAVGTFLQWLEQKRSAMVPPNMTREAMGMTEQPDFKKDWYPGWPNPKVPAFEQEILAGDNRANYQQKAMAIVKQIVDNKFTHVPRYHLYVVWFCKTLQNWKALISTTLEDGAYYEVTYDGNKKQCYVDSYVKVDNIVVTDASLEL